MIARSLSSSSVSFECVEPQGLIEREILGRVAFGIDWHHITSNWNSESELVEVQGFSRLSACVFRGDARLVRAS